MAGRGHNGHAWRLLTRRVLSGDYLICGICRRPIDKTLRYPDPWSKSVDLIVPWSLGGSARDIHNLQPAHLFCNVSRGNGRRGKRGTNQPKRWLSDDRP